MKCWFIIRAPRDGLAFATVVDESCIGLDEEQVGITHFKASAEQGKIVFRESVAHLFTLDRHERPKDSTLEIFLEDAAKAPLKTRRKLLPFVCAIGFYAEANNKLKIKDKLKIFVEITPPDPLHAFAVIWSSYDAPLAIKMLKQALEVNALQDTYEGKVTTWVARWAGYRLATRWAEREPESREANQQKESWLNQWLHSISQASESLLYARDLERFINNVNCDSHSNVRGLFVRKFSRLANARRPYQLFCVSSQLSHLLSLFFEKLSFILKVWKVSQPSVVRELKRLESEAPPEAREKIRIMLGNLVVPDLAAWMLAISVLFIGILPYIKDISLSIQLSGLVLVLTLASIWKPKRARDIVRTFMVLAAASEVAFGFLGSLEAVSEIRVHGKFVLSFVMSIFFALTYISALVVIFERQKSLSLTAWVWGIALSLWMLGPSLVLSHATTFLFNSLFSADIHPAVELLGAGLTALAGMIIHIALQHLNIWE